MEHLDGIEVYVSLETVFQTALAGKLSMLSRLSNLRAVSHLLPRTCACSSISCILCYSWMLILIAVFLKSASLLIMESQLRSYRCNISRNPQFDSPYATEPICTHIQQSKAFRNTYYDDCLRALQFRHASTSISMSPPRFDPASPRTLDDHWTGVSLCGDDNEGAATPSDSSLEHLCNDRDEWRQHRSKRHLHAIEHSDNTMAAHTRIPTPALCESTANFGGRWESHF